MVLKFIFFNMTVFLLATINGLRAHKRQPPIEFLDSSMRLREDLGFDSLDLAELTVRIEARFGVDVFSAGLLTTIGEVEAKILAFRD